jgi:23S rRNA-/tRNA-specific pseudouridylate synthase
MPLPPILCEDDAFVAFDKPSGLSIAPERGVKPGENLMAMIQAQFGRAVAGVHRLDTDTSGVFLCAKTKPALDALSGQFQSKTAQKLYLAFAVVLPPEEAMKVVDPVRGPGGGLPPEFTVDLALGPNPHQTGHMQVFRKHGGKPGVTEFKVREAFGRFVWLECRPLTGRTHQIRIHLAAIGAPVLNDSYYGDPAIHLRLSELKRRYKGRDEERPLIGRLALHASELTFKHPVTGAPVTVAAPAPHEFEIALKYLRKFPPGLSPLKFSRPAFGKDSG